MNQEMKAKRKTFIEEMLSHYSNVDPMQFDYAKAELRVIQQPQQTGVFEEAPEGALKSLEEMENERRGRIYVNHEMGWI